MQILNIAGYKFTSLTDLPELRERLLNQCLNLGIKGTILLSSEGINLSLAAPKDAILTFQDYLAHDASFSSMSFHESYSDYIPFKRLKVKLKKEIITLRQPEANPNAKRAPAISPALFKEWLDENKDITVLDTRNDYEVKYGSFTKAIHLSISDFSNLPKQLAQITKTKPVVMFCTGGIRCEKAALHMMNEGFNEVYQLDGGILGYFAQVGGEHYQGECFVFDERVAVDCHLTATGPKQCADCSGPVDACTHTN